MLATTVGTPMKKTPCQASSRTYWLSKAAMPASAAMTSDSATLVYQRGARKMYFERLASSPWVSVMLAVPAGLLRADVDEVLEDRFALFGVGHFGVPLDAVEVAVGVPHRL